MENNATVTVTPENTQGVDESVETNETNETKGSETQPEVEPKKPEDDFVPFPKKAQNAISRRDRTIGKLQARTRELEARLNEFMTREAPKQAEDKGPQEKDFNTYGEYVEARAEWKAEKKLEQRLAEFQKTNKEADAKNKVTAEQQQYFATRAQEIDKKSAEYSASIPDFDDIQEQNVEIVASLPREIQMAMLEADDPALAFYNLAKEGRLVELANMTPTRAAMVIALASKKPPSKPTQAPKPLQGVNGTGQGGGGLSNLDKDTDALKQWMKKKGLR